MSKNVVDMTLRANMDLSQISSGVSQVQNILKKLKLSPELRRSFDGLFDETLTDLDKLQKRIEAGFKTKGDVFGFERATSSLDSSFKKIEDKIFKLYNLTDKELFKLDPSLKGDIEAIERKFEAIAEDFPDDIKKGLQSISGEVGKLVKDTQKKAGKEILEKVNAKDYTGALKQAEQKLRQQQLAYDNNIYAQKGTVVPQQIAAYTEIVKVLREAISYQDQFNNKTKYLEAEKAERYAKTLNSVKNSLEQAQGVSSRVSQGFKEVSANINRAGQETVSFNNELDSIKSRIQYFFSLTNSVMIFRRILQDTIQTTKELDAVMTETAVVTDFSVADMWKELPRYTETAKELGATIQGVYETMTLYYQQGLDTNEAFEVGTETLKMAKIAGLDYAQATDFMTAALRGFNMEVNELNAQKVNDVYSELAAITAADTQEIATAMTKTASIASSANMEFETTAAFLSQIIETTRESAETAGTAMKTVIARFTELKKDPAEIGEVDGEIVDANKIETALRTIGVALRDTSGQFRDLDDVFLDIAEKWDGLDTNTQRYIATMAAGSRQQSRFIAMMSDYSRTMELVSAANNSAGAAQQQFDKTLESLEAKLNRLKDAWDQFTMGIANNTLIKVGVDALTIFINLINKLTEWLPGATKGVGRLLVLFGGFKAGEKLFRAFSSSILADLTALSNGAAKAGQHVGDSFFGALKKEFKPKRKLGLTDFFKNEVDSINKMASEVNIEFPKKPVFDSQEAFKDPENYVSAFTKELEDYETQVRNVSATVQQNQQIQQAMNDFTDLGVQKEVAATMAKRGLTLEEIKAGAAKKFNKESVEDLTEEEIQQYLTEKMTSGELAKNNLLIKLRKLVIDQETGATKNNTTAKIANWVITKILNQEWLKLALAIAGVVAVIAVVVGAFKLLSNLIETNAEKQARFSKAIEQTSKSMQDSKAKVDDIKSSMEELGTLDSEFDGLIKGSEAWKEKLVEINNKVLELLQNYPMLAQYISKGVNGELTISSEGWDAVLEQQQNKINAASLANTVATNQKEISGRNANIQEAAKESGLTEGSASAPEIFQLVKKFAKADKYLLPGEDNSDVLKNTIGLEDDLNAILNKTNGIAEFNNLINMYKTSMLQTQKSTEALASQLVSQNDKVAGTDYEEGIAKAIAAQIDTGSNGNLPTEIYNVLEDKYGTYGLDGQYHNLDKSKIWEDYAAYSGEDLSTIKENYKDDDDGTYALALELASQQAAEKLTSSADLIITGLKKIGSDTLNISDDWENIVKNLFSGGLTEKDLETYYDFGDFENRLKFEELPLEIQEYFNNDRDAWSKFLANQVTLAQQQRDEANALLESLNITDLNTSELSTDAILGLAKNLQEVYYKSGEDGVTAIKDAFNTVIKDLPKDQAEKFAASLNGIKWDSVSSINDLKNILEEIGVTVEDSELELLTTNIIKFNKAVKGVSLEELTSKLETLNNLTKDFEDREYDQREFTKEEKDQLTSLEGIDESLFVGYGDSWMYVGNSLKELEAAVKENTSALLQSTIDELEKQKDTADFVTQSEQASNLANYGVLNTEARQALLAGLLEEAKTYTNAEGETLTQLGNYDTQALQSLTQGELDAAQVSFLNELLSMLSSAIGTGDFLQDQIDSTNKELGVQQYANASTSEMANVAINSEDPIEMQKATEALLYKAAQYTQLNDEIKKYNDALAKNDKALQDEAKRELATGVAIAEKAKKIDKLSDKIQDNIDSLEDMDKESNVYEETLEDIASMINEVFDADIDKEFISGENAENLQLLNEGLNDNQDAWNQFLVNLMQAKVNSDEFASQFTATKDQLLAAISQLDAAEFNIDGTADVTDVVTSLMQAGETGSSVAKFLELLTLTNVELTVQSDMGEIVKDLSDIKTIDDLNALAQEGSIKITATNSYVPAASMANQFGGGGGSSGGGGGGGGGDSGSEEQPWENSFDKFYNITEDINELLDKRNELEAEYEAILQNENATIDDYLNSYLDRIASFKEEIALQKEMLRLRQLEQEDILSDNSHLSEYAWVEDGKVQIDFEAIDQVEDQELGQEIEEYVKALEENDDAIQEATDAITENTTAIEDLLDEWRDKAADFEQRVFDAIVEQREKEIEKLEEASEAIENSNSDLVDAIQKEVDERRKQRENEETEKDLAEKERRLAYLQQDTSGAYDTEILQLEKELKQQKEDYTDTLIDQRIADLEKQNDEAAKQREKQIQIAQYQLKNDQDMGIIARQVSQMLREANSDEGWNRVWGLLEKSEGFKGLTDTNKAVWTEDTQVEFKEAMSYLNGLDGGGIAAALANISTAAASTYDYTDTDYSYESEDSDDYDDYDYDSYDYRRDAEREDASSEGNTKKSSSTNTSTTASANTKVKSQGVNLDGTWYYQDTSGKWYKGSELKNITNRTFEVPNGVSGRSSLLTSASKTTGVLGTATSAASAKSVAKEDLETINIAGTNYYKYGGYYYTSSQLITKKNGQKYQAYLQGGYKAFKTGGLADYTGPAWLDGTKSRPELVLNQKDTQNFLQLKDVLGSFMKQTKVINNSSSVGDTIYDISISVDKMNSDYDVEQVASKIKQMITNDAAYRNSTMIQRLR